MVVNTATGISKICGIQQFYMFQWSWNIWQIVMDYSYPSEL